MQPQPDGRTPLWLIITLIVMYVVAIAAVIGLYVIGFPI